MTELRKDLRDYVRPVLAYDQQRDKEVSDERKLKDKLKQAKGA
jgi:hypothetical protein